MVSWSSEEVHFTHSPSAETLEKLPRDWFRVTIDGIEYDKRAKLVFWCLENLPDTDLDTIIRSASLWGEMHDV